MAKNQTDRAREIFRKIYRDIQIKIYKEILRKLSKERDIERCGGGEKKRNSERELIGLGKKNREEIDKEP